MLLLPDNELIGLEAEPKKDAKAKLADQAIEIWGQGARDAGTLTYWPRALLQVTLPHHNPGNMAAWGRRSGDHFLIVEPGHKMDKNGKLTSYGFPYGSIPRLLFSYLNRQVKLHRKPVIDLGGSLSEFMTELGLGPYRTGGRNGNITRLRNQTLALFRAKIAFGYDPGGMERGSNSLIANEYELWWDPHNIEQGSLYQNWVKLSEPLYEEMQEHGIPLDMRALNALKRSPLALDLYAWATYRNFNRKSRLAVSWAALAQQFGTEYSDLKNFSRKARAALDKVKLIYPDLDLEYEPGRLILGARNSHAIRRK